MERRGLYKIYPNVECENCKYSFSTGAFTQKLGIKLFMSALVGVIHFANVQIVNILISLRIKDHITKRYLARIQMVLLLCILSVKKV